MADKIGKILAIDDNEDILFSLKLLLKKHVEKIKVDPNPENIPQLMTEDQYDVILLDMNFTKDAISGKEGFHWLEKILEIDPNAVVLFITAYGDTEKAVNAIKSGATDFIVKPWQNEKLIASISSSVKLYRSKAENAGLKIKQKGLNAAMDAPFKDFIGESEGMKRVFATINKVAGTDASVLILGENGTGKEMVARALHRKSLRNEEVFVSVDLGAVPETLFESELFGHEKGAFTDAKKEKPGRFEIADKGTLFLDEIGNLSLPMQAKILSALERREINRVGATKKKNIDIRLICATNAEIHERAAKDEFRQDLLYRINTVEIHLPPLRERVDDIELLANHFIGIYAKKYNKGVNKISAAALKKLESYNWPGNIRELQHAVERAIIMTDSTALQPDDFILHRRPGTMDELELDTFNLEEIEKKLINKVMKKHKGNISHAAKDLGLTRTSLYRRLEKHDL